MKQPGVFVILIIFVAAVSFVVGSEQFKSSRMKSIVLNGTSLVSADRHASGNFKYRISESESQICYELKVTNVAMPTSVTISLGRLENSGAAPLSLQVPKQDTLQGCATVDADRLSDMVRHPSNYYVNVLNAEFPAGAMVGQLK